MLTCSSACSFPNAGKQPLSVIGFLITTLLNPPRAEPQPAGEGPHSFFSSHFQTHRFFARERDMQATAKETRALSQPSVRQVDVSVLALHSHQRLTSKGRPRLCSQLSWSKLGTQPWAG